MTKSAKKSITKKTTRPAKAAATKRAPAKSNFKVPKDIHTQLNAAAKEQGFKSYTIKGAKR